MEYTDLPDKLIEILRAESKKIGESALMLSGGVDSSLILAIFGEKVYPYTISYNESIDLKESRYISSFFNIELRELNVSKEDIIDASREIEKLDPTVSTMELSFEIPFYIGCKNIEESNIVTGQGADEIFYGYSKFRDGREQTNKLSMETLKKRTIPRENKISDKFGKIPIMPYMNVEIESFFANLPPEMHMNKERNKLIIRKACEKVGIPERIYNRPKKAAQYGSGIMKVVREMRGVTKI
ncbi:asparagine synthase C-terminal domain-containing protein [Cuniculiplasma sp. SKW4]|uniref:asparagine synthase C-terminal domain-containing protein n=1 Tax=Cuniculiplasma sp. SKW4 TaxID=3400171 RepID=UPI003FCF3BD7